MVTVCLLPFDLQLKNSNKLVYHTFSIQISIFRLWWWQGNKKENTKKKPRKTACVVFSYSLVIATKTN